MTEQHEKNRPMAGIFEWSAVHCDAAVGYTTRKGVRQCQLH